MLQTEFNFVICTNAWSRENNSKNVSELSARLWFQRASVAMVQNYKNVNMNCVGGVCWVFYV